MTFLTRTLVGIPVSFVILIFFVGGEAPAFMVLSIICTLGISLVVWVPIWFVLGWIVLGIGRISGAIPESKRPTRISTQHERDVKGVVAYMRSAEASGLSKEQITRKLESAGWSNAIIDEARKNLPPVSQIQAR